MLVVALFLLCALLTGLAVATYLHPQTAALYKVSIPLIPGGVALSGFVLSGAILWLSRTPHIGHSGQSYRELASELSQIAGKSEVVINAINDGVIALDGKGNIQLINPAAQQLLGWTKQDAMGLAYRSIIKILDTKNQPVADNNDPITQAQFKNQVVKNDSFSLQTNSGKSFLAAISVSPVGQPGSGVIIVFRDITSEKSDERQRAEFISTASHEMRTPVASIEGYLGLALNPATATIDAKARDFITKAHEAAQHLGRLFQDLLDVSKADDSRLKNDPSVIDIVPFIQGIVEGLTPKANDKGLRILYKPMPETGKDEGRRLNPVYYVNVDNDHLREIADNLIENAIKYTPKGDVIIDITGDNSKVILSIADTGIGIPREDQAHLFQKFYRVDNRDTREIGGTGLGLYLCRRLAEAMGGRIWVESEYKKGSTFFIELPRLAHDEATRMIEQASVDAEKQMSAEQAIAATDAQMSAVEQQLSDLTFTLPSMPEPAPSAAVVVETASAPIASVVAPVIPAHPLPAPSTNPQGPVAYHDATPAPVNTPISAIEANPGQFTRSPQPGISVPPRQ